MSRTIPPNLTPAKFVVKLPVAEWSFLFLAYRVVMVGGDEIVQGILRPEYDEAHADVQAMLGNWPGTHFLHQTADGVEVTLVRPVERRVRERWWLHALLGALTLLTTTIAGGYFVGRDPLVLRVVGFGPVGLPIPIGIVPADVVPGLAFSVPLLAILLAHEMGHFLAARRYGMNVSPPYFIPAPPWINVVGTFGAFIRLRSAMVNRVMLLDVGVGGPVVSFVLSLPAVALGVALSRPFPPGAAGPGPYAVVFGGQPIWLGGSLLFDAMAALFGGGGGLLLHPLAFAGWLGLFVTAMNLFPLAQLDGGHILYALVGRAQRYGGIAFLGVLLALGRLWWGWWIWTALILLLGRGTVTHPPVLDPDLPVLGVRRAIGWACVVVFVLTFVPVPLRV